MRALHLLPLLLPLPLALTPFLFLGSGCDDLWQGRIQSHPRNCILNPGLCSSSEICSEVTEVCERIVQIPDLGPDSSPLSCLDIRGQQPAAADGYYTLYVGRDPTKPWTAYCKDMAGSPLEYLALPVTDAANFSQYTAASAAGGTSVRTHYQRVRIDPGPLYILVTDQTFAYSTGLYKRVDSFVVTSVSYAAAGDCTGHRSATGVGNVNLVGTPFAVAPDAFVVSGYMPAGGATYGMNDQVVALTGGGYCGDIVSATPPGTQLPLGTALPLVYIGR